MSLTPEDGTGLADANVYADLEYVRAYHDGRGQLATWDGTSVSTSFTGDAADDSLAVVAHPFESGDGPVRLTGADLPDGLEADTDYWIVAVGADEVSLAESYEDATSTPSLILELADDGSGADLVIVHPDFDAQRAACVLATDHIENIAGHRFNGTRETSTQALSWPRVGVYDERGAAIEGVPDVVKKAQAEYALRALSSPLLPDPSGSTHVTSKSESVGPISESVEYAVPTPLIPEYPAADRLLRSVTRSGARAYR